MDVAQACPWCNRDHIAVNGFTEATRWTFLCRNGECPERPTVVGRTYEEALDNWNALKIEEPEARDPTPASDWAPYLAILAAILYAKDRLLAVAPTPGRAEPRYREPKDALRDAGELLIHASRFEEQFKEIVGGAQDPTV